MNKGRANFVIPIEMCQWVLQNKFVRPFQLYIYLKSQCDGAMKITKEDRNKIASHLGLKSEKSIRNNLLKLQQHNWIGYDKHMSIYFIRGFSKVKSFYKFKRRTGVVFNMDDIIKIKAFLAGAVICKLIKSQKYQRMKRASALHGGSAKHLARQSFFPVACKALAKILKISPSTAFHLKTIANKEGYIKIMPVLKNTGVKANLYKRYVASYPELTTKIRLRRGGIHLQESDLIASNMVFRTRKKIE